MKKLMYGIFVLALVGVGVVACNKYSKESNEAVTTNNSNTYDEKVGPGFRIFTVQLHRPEGKINKEGVDCNCVFCAGFCEFIWFPDRNRMPTVGVDFISGTKARLYFFEDLDVDDVNTPIFHIDSEVSFDNFKLASGGYHVVNSIGVINYNSVNYNYKSYIDVPYKKI
ncbi:hypothetical protein D3C87_278280 [compost metagenome]